jgi:GWxTD domain-containing protein
MSWFSRSVFISAGLACLISPLAAQRRKEEMPAKYKKWLDEEVVYIITEDERKAFLRLTEDRARDAFIEDFWAIRNPVRSESTNPYKEEHYNRIQYANEHFGRQSNTAGWLTDMGRAWILFGKPVSQTRFIGLGQVYPCELWFYSNTTGDPSLPPFFYLLFYMPGDIGEYRFYRPYLNGPMELVRGSQFNTNKDVFDFLGNYGGDLARAAFTLIPNDPIDTQTYKPIMTSDMLVSRIRDLANDPYNVGRIRQLRSLHESVRSFFLVADRRPLDLTSIVLTDPSGQSWIDYSVSVDVPELGIPAPDNQNLNVVLSYQLKAESGEVIVEDLQQRTYPAFEATDGQKRFQPFQIAGRIPVIPGKYRLEVELHQNDSGKSFRGFQNIVIAGTDAVAISGPLLVSSVEQVAKPDGATPFQYFGSQFHPAARRQFTAESQCRVLLQLTAPAPPADYEIEYVLAHTQLRDTRRTITETVHASQFRSGRLLESKALPLAGLAEGDYRLVVNMRRVDNPEVVAASTNTGLHLVANAAQSALYFDPNTRQLAQQGVASYIRALAALGQKDQAAATAYLRQAVDQNPANLFADTHLVDLYFRLKQYADITRLYDRLGIMPFENSAEALAQISVSLWNQGDQNRAREVLQSARNSFPANPLVDAVAKTVR